MLRRTVIAGGGLSVNNHWSLNATNGWGMHEGHNMCRMQLDERLDSFGEKWMMNHQQHYVKTNSEMAKGDVRQVELPFWQQKTRPTHFLSMRVPANTLLQRHVESLRYITERDMKHFLPLLVPAAKLHLTLSVMTFHEDEALLVPKVNKVLQEAFRTYQRPLQEQRSEKPFTLRFHGLGRFGQGKVIFARVQSDYDSQRLEERVMSIRKALSSIPGVEVKGNPHDSYTPHATVAKVSAKAKRVLSQTVPLKPGEKPMETVPRELYDPHANDDFGLVQFSSLDLCSMKGEAPDGYYRTLCKYQL